MAFKDERKSRLGKTGGEFEKQADPNLMQVLAACAVIRMEWSDDVREARWQMARFRQQSAHCPPELREMLNGSG